MKLSRSHPKIDRETCSRSSRPGLLPERSIGPGEAALRSELVVALRLKKRREPCPLLLATSVKRPGRLFTTNNFRITSSPFTLLRRSGFTLIEILLVISLLAMIGAAVYRSFSNGLKVWDHSRKLIIEEDIAIFFEKFSDDLHNSFAYSRIPFEGREDHLKFATIVTAKADAKLKMEEGALLSRIGQVEYYFDPGQRILYKRQANYGQALRHGSGSERPLLARINDIKFLYYFGDSSGKLSTTKSINNVPAAVLVDVEFTDDGNPRTMKKLVNIPMGS